MPTLSPLLAFGPHPDDIEFAAGAIIALETRAGRPAHFVLCSRGESASHGTPDQRTAEAEKAAAILGATLEFLDLDGDAHLELRAAHALKLAAIIRRLRPALILAPTPIQNQHPDHWRLATLVRDATRLARYAGLAELRASPPHTITHLLFYAVTPEAEPRDITPILIDISAPEILAAWTASMEAHTSQMQTRNYLDHQLTRARYHALRAGNHRITHALPLFPNDPIRLYALAQILP